MFIGGQVTWSTVHREDPSLWFRGIWLCKSILDYWAEPVSCELDFKGNLWMPYSRTLSQFIALSRGEIILVTIYMQQKIKN